MNFTYSLTADPDIVLRSDGAELYRNIRDEWLLYDEWVSDGNTPIPFEPDWDGLIQQTLGGVLAPLYNRLTLASFVNPDTASLPEIANANNIAVAAGKLDQAVATTRVEGSVTASIQLLLSTSDYVFTQAEKDLWNSTIAELGFSDLVKL